MVVVRRADNGLPIVADPYGRVVAAMDHFTANEPVLVVQAPAKAHVLALHPIIGDLFGWMALAGLAGMIAFVMVRRRAEQWHTLPSPS